MEKIQFLYGKGTVEAEISESRFAGALTSDLNSFVPGKTPEELVNDALENPVGSPHLSELSKGKKRIVILCSDHTRPVPSRLLIPALLHEIRAGNPDADITLLIATGCHRSPTEAELRDKFGDVIYSNEKIAVHDCDDGKNLVKIGTLPSGGELIINRTAAECDLLVSEGFIEPHFFAGFSGGRKSVLPGIASRKTVVYNHNGAFIANPNARTGMLEGNPVHADMLYAASTANLAFILNIVLNSRHEPVFAVAGNCEQAHLAGCEFLSLKCRVTAPKADIVISTNGGYPLDQNIYQSVKGMTAAEAAVRNGGVIIMLSQCVDGHGGDNFYNTFKNCADLSALMAKFESTPPADTVVDQWQSQVFARVLMKAPVIFLSDADDEIVRAFHMHPAHTFSEALVLADEILKARGIVYGKIMAIPDGVSVIVG